MFFNAAGNQAIDSPPAAGSIAVPRPRSDARHGDRSPTTVIAATSPDSGITSRRLQLRASQTCTVSSNDGTMRLQSGEYAALITIGPSSPKQASSAPPCASQTRTVWSIDAVTTRRPSGEYAMLQIVP